MDVHVSGEGRPAHPATTEAVKGTREPADLLIEAAIVVVGDGTIIRDGTVAVRGEHIVGVGDRDDIAARFDGTTLDRRGHLLMPGLVNAHTHLAMTLLRGIAEGVDLQGFLERVFAAEDLVMAEPEGVAIGTRLAAAESLLAGGTTALDMYFHPEAAHRAAAELGMRHLTGPLFLEESNTDKLRWDERIAFAAAWADVLSDVGGPWVPSVLQPHGTYTVAPEPLAEVAQIAIELGAVVHIHVSETQAENAIVMQRHGRTPSQVLTDAGMLAQRVVLAHGVHLDDDDLAVLAAVDAGVAHCPVSNLKLASGMANVPRLRDAGLTVGLGTDGCSSSNDLDPWIAMRTAALVATGVTGEPAALTAAEVVEMATHGGAELLGLGDRIGFVREGMEADLITLDLDAPHLTPIHDVHALLVYAAGRSDVDDVFVAGRQVVEAGVLLSAETGALQADARGWVEHTLGA